MRKESNLIQKLRKQSKFKKLKTLKVNIKTGHSYDHTHIILYGRYRILTALKDYILEYLPKIKNEVRNNVNWLTDVYYHDIASSVITNG